ncbi:MAG: acylphosphatase [Candidatus Hodarchaeales archaeon]
MKRVKIVVSGRVQGVFFRVYTREFARKFEDITGYVRNLPDGRVEVVAEGSNSSLKELAKWLKEKGSPASTVTKTEEFWEENIGSRKFKDFKITY